MSIDRYSDIIDSREVIDRIEELYDEFLEATEAEEDIDEGMKYGMSDDDWRFGLTDDDAEELYSLLQFERSARSESEWDFGMTFIRDSHFVEYVQELITELGYVSENMPEFIRHNIDWEGVASDLQSDYSEYEYDGVMYWAR